MKKVQTSKTKKLTLGKTTVAKLQISQRQMALLNGGNATKPIKPINNSLVHDDNNPCTTQLPSFGVC